MFHDEVEDTLVLEQIEEGDNATMSDHAQDVSLERDELLLPVRCAVSDPASCPNPAVRRDLRVGSSGTRSIRGLSRSQPG